MIMPAPFYPGPTKEHNNDKPLSRNQFLDALTELGKERYHSLHPFHKLLHSGKLSFSQVQAWALNRFYYQWSIPRKDLTLMARINDVNLRLEWRSRVIDHEGDIDGSGGISRYLHQLFIKSVLLVYQSIMIGQMIMHLHTLRKELIKQEEMLNLVENGS